VEEISISHFLTGIIFHPSLEKKVQTQDSHFIGAMFGSSFI
jgi:hypothetical protein